MSNWRYATLLVLAILFATKAKPALGASAICPGCCNDGCRNSGYVTIPGDCPSHFVPCGLNVAISCDGQIGYSFCAAFDRGATCDIECWEGKACTGCSEGGGCFLPNTKITTPEGERNIQELKVGDKVIGMDTDKKEKKETSVENIYQTEREGYYEIELEGSDGTRHLVRVTGEHPLWVKRKVSLRLIWEILLTNLKELLRKV